MKQRQRLGFAMIAYALLGLLIWTTMSDIPIKIAGGQISIRGLTLAIVAFFAVRTLLHWKSTQAQRQDDEEFES
jgi:hypothetical protein